MVGRVGVSYLLLSLIRRYLFTSAAKELRSLALDQGHKTPLEFLTVPALSLGIPPTQHSASVHNRLPAS
jgi:hypothetical protein